MRAVIFDQPGDEDVLRVGEVARPVVGAGEVRIRVAAAGVNRADLLQRRGLYPPPPGTSDILGLECSGTITAIGAGVNGFEPGQRVMALLAGGGYAEEAVVPAVCVMHTPDGLTDEEAAGVPEVFITAFLNLFLIGGLQAGDSSLIHGGSGGVGTAAIQLAKTAGAQVLVTAGNPERCARCLELGADSATDHRQGDFAAVAIEATGGAGVDVILDCIGAPYLARHLEVLAIGGRLVVIGLQGGATAEIDLSQLMRRRVSVTGSTLRARAVEEKSRIIHAFLDRFGADLTSGRIKPVIDRVVPLEEVAGAHRSMAAGEIFGKLVLRVG